MVMLIIILTKEESKKVGHPTSYDHHPSCRSCSLHHHMNTEQSSLEKFRNCVLYFVCRLTMYTKLFSVHVRVSGNGGALQRGWYLQGKKRGETILVNITQINFLRSPKTIFKYSCNSFSLSDAITYY